MPEDLVHHRVVDDERDNLHLTAAPGAHQGIDLDPRLRGYLETEVGLTDDQIEALIGRARRIPYNR